MINEKIQIGSKFFRYISKDESPEVIRITNSDPVSNKVKFIGLDKKRYSMKYTDLIENYKMLRADGIIIISIVYVDQAPDVIVGLKPFPYNDENPYAICRQGIFDFFSNNIQNKYNQNITNIGISVSQDTCPANIDFKDVLSCSSIDNDKNTSICVYLDDTLDDILSLFQNRKYDEALRRFQFFSSSIHENTGKEVVGLCDTLKELLESNNFMYDFRKCFKIMELPYSIDLDYESLSKENLEFLSKELSIDDIIETYVAKYDRDIDLNKINRDYILASSASESHSNIYIIGYDRI